MPTHDAHDMIRQLTQPHTHLHTYTRDPIKGTTQIHRVNHPPLLTQLTHTQPLTGDTQPGTNTGYQSKPTAHLEALDTLTRIDLEAARWIRDLGEDDPGSTISCVRKLGSLLPTCTHTQTQAITQDIHRWWTWARTITGIDTPPTQLDNTCPLCEQRGTLRIRITELAGFCINCHATWSETRGTLGLLAEHIRAENGDVLVETTTM